jgi:hypothetical protein
MNFYIKVVNGSIVNHPILEENLLEAFEISKITQDFLNEQHLVRYERREIPVGSVPAGADVGYELCEDGVVRNILATRELTQEEKVNDWIRRPRNFFLTQSDWTQLSDAPLTEAKKAEWAAYRQQLRDMPTVYASIQNPSELVIPTLPSK